MTRPATPSVRRQPLLSYVLNYLRETGYRLFRPGRGNGVIFDLPVANSQLEIPVTNPVPNSSLSDDESEWDDAIQEGEETENGQTDYEVKDILEQLLCQLETERQEKELTFESDICENLSNQLEPYKSTEKSNEQVADKPKEVEELNRKLVETSIGCELKAPNKIENDDQIVEDVRKILNYIMDQLDDYSVLQPPNDCVLVTVVTDENLEAMVTEVNFEVMATDASSEAIVTEQEGNSETIVSDGSSKTLVTEGISGIMLTKTNIAIDATKENSDTMVAEVNSEAMEAEGISETLVNNEDSYTMVPEGNTETSKVMVTSRNSYTLITEGNFGTMVTVRNSGTNSEPMITETISESMLIKNSEPMVIEINSEPMVIEINSEPMVIEINSEPMAIEINSEPIEIEISFEPMVIEINSEPMVTEETSETQVTGRTSHTIVDVGNSDVMFTDENFEKEKERTLYKEDFPTENHLEDEIDPSLSSKISKRRMTSVWSIDDDSDESESHILGKHSYEDLAGSSLKRSKSFYEIENETLSLTDLIKIHNETYEVLNDTPDQLQETNEICNVDRHHLRDPNVEILTDDSVNKIISEVNVLSENSNSNWTFSNNQLTTSTECYNVSRPRETNSFLNLNSGKAHSISSFENECQKPLKGKKNWTFEEKFVKSPTMKPSGIGDVSTADLERIQRIKDDVWTPFEKGTLEKSKPQVLRASSESSRSSNAISNVPITPKPSEKSLRPHTQSAHETHSKTFSNIPLSPKSQSLSDLETNDPSTVKLIRDQPGYKSHSFHYGPNIASLNMSFEYGIKASRDQTNSQIVFEPMSATEMPGCKEKGYETSSVKRRNLKTTSSDDRAKEARLDNRKPYTRSCVQKKTS